MVGTVINHRGLHTQKNFGSAEQVQYRRTGGSVRIPILDMFWRYYGFGATEICPTKMGSCLSTSNTDQCKRSKSGLMDLWCDVIRFGSKKLIKGIISRNCFQTPPGSVCQRCTFNKTRKTWMSKCLSVPYAVVRPSSQPALTTTRHTWQVQLLARYLAEYPGTGHSVDGFNKPHRGLAVSKWKW